MPLYNQALFDEIIGQTMTPSAITALGGDCAAYVTAFQTYSEAQEPPPADANLFLGAYNYYDRANLYFAWYKMGGYSNSTYLTRALAIAERYRDDFVLPNPGGFQPHQQFVRGLGLHYAATGDADSLEAIRIIADYNGLIWYPRIVEDPKAPNIDGDRGSGDERIWARCLESFLMAAACGVTSSYGYNYATKAANTLTAILNAQYADGAWRSAAQSYPNFGDPTWYARPFYMGLVSEALILSYNLVGADARIPPAIRAAAEYMFTGSAYNLWHPTDVHPSFGTWHNSFKYLEHSTFDETDSGYGAPDLNGIVLNMYAFTYAHTGVATWQARALLIINGITYANVYLRKQFNETFSGSYKAFPMLATGVVDTPPPPDLTPPSAPSPLPAFRVVLLRAP